jgi:hypothetical protein
MVAQSGFRIELVEANTKKAYKEHVKDGKVYAEVEPDAEYFVSVQKISKLSEERYAYEVRVDDHNLGWTYEINGESIEEDPAYVGLCQEDSDSVLSHRALKFVKPAFVNAINSDTGTSSPPPLFGTVTVKICEAGAEYYVPKEDSKPSSLPMPSIGVGDGQLKEHEKNVRSTEGDLTVRHGRNNTSYYWTKKE